MRDAQPPLLVPSPYTGPEIPESTSYLSPKVLSTPQDITAKPEEQP